RDHDGHRERARRPGAGAAAGAAAVRHHQGHGQRLYLSLRQPSVDVHRHARGVIATDPISERRPVKPYIDAIQAVTKAPIKYVIYSHSHFDHIAGGKPFKDLGATFVAHANAKARIAALKPDDVVIPDQVVGGGKRNVTLGGTTLELNYVGKNHSDSTLVMRLP